MENSTSFKKKTCCLAKMLVNKTKKVVEISQLKFKMGQVRSKIERKFACIGSKMYRNHKEANELNSNVDEFKDVCEEIDKLYVELNEIQRELESIRSMHGGCCGSEKCCDEDIKENRNK